MFDVPCIYSCHRELQMWVLLQSHNIWCSVNEFTVVILFLSSAFITLTSRGMMHYFPLILVWLGYKHGSNHLEKLLQMFLRQKKYNMIWFEAAVCVFLVQIQSAIHSPQCSLSNPEFSVKLRFSMHRVNPNGSSLRGFFFHRLFTLYYIYRPCLQLNQCLEIKTTVGLVEL